MNSTQRLWFTPQKLLWRSALVLLIATASVRAQQESLAVRTARAKQQKEAAESVARAKGWQIRGKDGAGRTFELMRLEENGKPVYNITDNINAAISTGANQIRNTIPYNVNGSGFRVGVWDAGSILANHQEFAGRLFIMDGGEVSDHATHVGGTIGAAGVKTNALGMAPSVHLDSYDWNSDTVEMEAAGATNSNHSGKILISNHSYGIISGWYRNEWGVIFYEGNYPDPEDYKFGLYDTEAQAWDRICTNAPYYLPFKAAGNDRADTAPAPNQVFYYYNPSIGDWSSRRYNPTTDPKDDAWDNGGFDTLPTYACAKNIVTIGAVNDAVQAGQRAATNGTISWFSSWGPTDDGRIKPDLVADGVDVYSTWDTATNAYASSSGTSMASPNAAGSAILLQQLYASNYAGAVMRASSLKALLIQTATDLGRPGPDYCYGWGLINVKDAADYIRNPTNRSIIEGSLSTNKPIDSYTISWGGASPVRATLCWTDPPGAAKTNLDDRTRVLVNDLDLRAFRGVATNFPYVLSVTNPADNATMGDNITDNVEQVLIGSPSAGNYTFTVSCKTALTNGEQKYALILSDGLGNLQPYKPAGWSDKIVLSTTGGTIDSPTLLSTDDLYVSAAVVNSGVSPITTPWLTDFYVDGVWRAAYLASSLVPGADATWVNVNFGKLYAGWHTIRIKVDSTESVFEARENDNEYSRTFLVLPANDHFTNAQVLTGLSGTVLGGNGGATKQTGEPYHADVGAQSVWYQWTATITGTATIDTFGSSFDTMLAVYTGTAVNSLTPVASNNDYAPGIYQSRVSFEVVSGTTYRIAVDGFFLNSGFITLNYQVVPPAPLVLNANDNGPGSLRQLMTDLPAGSIITFSNSLAGSTIRLTSGQIVVTKNFTLNASALSGGIILDGNHGSRIFQVPAGVSLSLNSITLSNGLAAGSLGGAISSAGTLTMNNCTLVNNSAAQGGAIQIVDGQCSLTNSTICFNSSTGNSGAIDNSYNPGTLALTHCTVYGNSCGGAAAGIANYLRTLVLVNSIVAGNTGSADIVNFAGSTVVRDGANIVQTFSNSGTNLGPAALTSAPLLAPLGYYAGLTPTLPPVPGSPAINAATVTALASDQRGVPRPGGSVPDIGAVELQAPFLVVTTNADDGDGSLRQALRQSDLSSTITFDAALSGATILLTSGELFITNRNVIIDASSLPDGLQINGNANGRVFHLAGGATMQLDSLTITNGHAGVSGGAILNRGTLTLNNCTLAGNSADAYGGAIKNEATLTVNQCTLTGNSCNAGGGAAIDGSGTVVNHSTISGNSAPSPAGSGGIWGDVTINNSIVAGNSAGTPANDNLLGTITQLGVNLTNGNPQLASLGNYGGPTPTMPPLAGSPAIDAAAASAFGTDQRGGLRAQDGDGNGTSVPDIGAVEFVFLPVITIGDAQVTEGNSGQTVVAFPVTLSGQSALPVTVYFETVEGSAGGTDPLQTDYVPISGQVDFLPGTTGPIFIPVQVNGDTAYEADETFQISMSSPINGQLGNTLAVGTIVNDDFAVQSTLTMPTQLNDGSIQFGFTNVSGAPFTVFTSTNLALPLSQWSIIGAPVEVPPGSGQYQFTDMDATNSPQRFYYVTLGAVSKLRWASQVLAYSSAWIAAPNAPWSADQTLGEPDTYPWYGDIPTAWATETPDAPGEYIELRYSPPAPINTVSVYETFGPGSVKKISVRNPNTSSWEEVWSGVASPEPPIERIFTVTFPLTSYPVTDIRVEFDSLAVPGFSEIDAVSIGW